jgi:hypothetical protein
MATAPAPAATQPGAPAAPGAGGAPQPPASPPFRCGTQNTTNLDGYSVGPLALTTAQVPLTNYEPSVNSFLRGCWVNVAAAGGAGATSTAFTGDGPFSALAQVAFLDTQQRPIIQVTGYQLAQIVNKFGGYFAMGDPRANATFTAVAGASASGNFNFTLWVPLEINNRTGIGSALNKNSSQTYTLSLVLNNIAGVYSTAPSVTVPSVTITIFEDGWWQPQASDVSGAPAAQQPVAPNTWSYWLQSSYTGLNGAVQEQLTTGLGNSLRCVALNTYDTANGTRATGETDFPTTIQLIYKGTNLKNWPKTLWKTLMSQAYKLTSATADTANGPENGVYVLWQFMQDFSLEPGNSMNYALLDTDQGDQFQLLGTFNGSATMFELVNYIATVGNPAGLRAQR